MDLRQSENYANYMRSLGWIVEKIDNTNIFIKKILFFSVIKIQRPNKLDPDKLKLLAKKYRAIKINVEPGSGWHLLPTKSIIIDLQNINLPKDTKYEIRKANKLIIQQSNNIDEFYQLLKETMKIGGWRIPIYKEITNLYKAFQPNNSIILTCGVSACLLVWIDDTAHFMYAANSKKGLKMGGAYFILNEAIKFCQNKSAQGRSASGGKLKYLDLEGIYDERFPNENKIWQGFTKFKLGWSGKAVEY